MVGSETCKEESEVEVRLWMNSKMKVMLKRTRIVELQLRVGSEDRREEADGRLVRLPVGHGGSSEVVSVD